MGKFSKGIIFDILLAFGLIIILLSYYLKVLPIPLSIFIIFSIAGIIPVAVSAIDSLKNRRINIDLLASVALIFSYLAGQWTSAAFINLMLAFARLFDHWTQLRTGHLIEKLLKFRPETIRIKRHERIIEIKTDDVKVNDLVVVDSGERIPVDGTIESGQASLNESSLTGESELVVKKSGDSVYTSTLNESGSIVIKAERVGKDSRLAKIISLVEEASRKKAVSEKIADKFSQWYIISVFSGALILYLFTQNLNLILAVLLVVCADDIAVAIPLSFTATIARAAQMGILIKGSEVIEKLTKIKLIITDKTGTLTKGKPEIAAIETFTGTSLSQFDNYLCTISSGSRHPVNRAITQFLHSQNVTCHAAEKYQESPGEGLKAFTSDTTLIIGKLSYLEKNSCLVNQKNRQFLTDLQQKGYGLSVLAKDKKLLGVVAIKDGVKKNAAQAIVSTKKLGVKNWIMLTGDNQVVAKRVAEETGIAQYYHDVSPEEKYHFVEEHKKENPAVIAVIGDGVNDAAAMALADVSIAMGSIGSDAAIEASDVALMTDNLSKIPIAMDISRQNMAIIKQTFIIWGITNGLGLILVFTGLLDPSRAAAYNFITDFFPILNTLKLNLYRPTLGG